MSATIPEKRYSVDSPESSEREIAWKLRARNSLRTARDQALRALTEGNYENPNALFDLYKIEATLGEQSVSVDAGFKVGLRAVELNRDALGVEMLAASAVADIQSGIDWLSDSKHCFQIAEAYQRVAARQLTLAEPVNRSKPQGKIRVGYVVPNLIDSTNAPSQRISNLVKYHNYDKFEIRVYSAESFVKRTQNLSGTFGGSRPTAELAPQLLAQMAEAGVPFWAAPVSGSILNTTQTLAAQLQQDELDIAVYQASLACPIECMTAALRPVPKQVNINIGCPMYIDGIDMTTYFMRANYEREREAFAARDLSTMAITGGIDLHAELPPAPLRSDWNFPKDLKIMATAGNRLNQRMSPEFIQTICRVLAVHPRSAYLIIGPGDFQRQKDQFKAAGLLDRVGFMGPQRHVRHLLRLADVYVNEFPEGGAQSVMEAMSVGLPAVAMRYSNRHLHCCGAEYVGSEMTIASKDYTGYTELVTQLLSDPDFYKERAQKALNRVERVYSMQRCTQSFEELYESIL